MEHTSLSLKFTGYGAEKITFYYAISNSHTNAPKFSNKKSSLPADDNYSPEWWYPGVPKWLGTSGTYLWKLTETEFTDNSMTQQVSCLEIRDAAALIVSTYPSSYPTMGAWCEAAKTTIISGSEIVTNSITANHLTSDALKSENYNPGAANTLIPQSTYPLAGSYFDFKKGNFYSPSFVVRSNDNQAYFKGNITAESGTIGGFNIGNITLSSGDPLDLSKSEGENDSEGTKTVVGMCAESDHGPYAFWAGEGTFKNKPFKVGHKGEFWASNAQISGSSTFDGTIYAKAGGTIANFEITNDGLESPFVTINSRNVNFPEGSSFSLNDELTISNQTDASYITTDGSKHFILRNKNGAGVKFLANGEVQKTQQYVTLTINHTDTKLVNVPGMGQITAYRFGIDFQINNSGTLLDPATFTLYYNEKGTIKDKSITIPEKLNYGSIVVGSEYVNFGHGVTEISLSKTSGFGNPIEKYFTDIEATNNILYSLGSFCPNVENGSSKYTNLMLGDDSHIWKSITTQSYVINASDRNLKDNILLLTDKYEAFYDDLKPVSFTFKNGESGRTHTGFIAQDVEESLVKYNISTKDFAGICISKEENIDERRYFLRYEEFIPLNTHEIQKLKKRVTEQDQKILELEEKLSNLEKLIQSNEN